MSWTLDLDKYFLRIYFGDIFRNPVFKRACGAEDSGERAEITSQQSAGDVSASAEPGVLSKKSSSFGFISAFVKTTTCCLLQGWNEHVGCDEMSIRVYEYISSIHARHELSDHGTCKAMPWLLASHACAKTFVPQLIFIHIHQLIRLLYTSF